MLSHSLRFVLALMIVGCGASDDPQSDQGGGNSSGSALGGSETGGSVNAGGNSSGVAGAMGVGGVSTLAGSGGGGGKPNVGGGAGSAMGGAGSGGKGGAMGSGDASVDSSGPRVGGTCSPTAAGTDGVVPAVSYCTDFNLTEAPISEGGAWTHLGLDWTIVDTADGHAFGTQPGKGGYDDSYAHLTGFPANQTASAIIHKNATIDGSCTHEVEILLRWSDSAHDAHGYECNLAWDGGYAEIVRWNGKLGDFTYLNRSSAPGGVHDGDTLSASIVGNVITVTLNGKQIARATDSTFPTGNPGMAFWRGGSCGTRDDYGFTHYAAASLAP